MPKPNRNVVWTLIVLSVFIFALFCLPNSQASKDFSMLTIFEPDEGAIYTVVDRMTYPRGTLAESIRHFIRYDFYHYGFPFFGLCSTFAYPIRWLGAFDNTPLLMLVLRQLISVLPMIGSFLLLVYMQDGFRTYRSVLLYLLLWVVPASVKNSMWLHPDGLAFLLSVLVLFCLWKDNLRFKRHFYWAAAVCGVLIATKLIGLFFFLTILTLLIWGIRDKTLTTKQAINTGLRFILVMGLAFILANPFVFHFKALKTYVFTFYKETFEVSKGYALIYPVGIKHAWPEMRESYGESFFLLLSVITSVISLKLRRDKLLPALTITWFIPLTFLFFTTTHFKYQYWLPAVMPLLSNLIVIFPIPPLKQPRPLLQRVLVPLAVGLLVLQAFLFIKQDVQMISDQTNRAQNNPALEFDRLAKAKLAPLDGQYLRVYHDYRMYVPYYQGWLLTTSFDMLNNRFIEEGNFDVIMLQHQRIRDYLNPNVTAINQAELDTAREFYRPADQDIIPGYQLLFENDFGKLFVRDALCGQFPGGHCSQ
ncbi:MAG TPA: hypothetical protein PKK82_02275 [Anaerolineaceae bacterium]|nr:hypothetical protein [Anaerolineaceae bacterium]